jgi:hypothetical protein
METLGEAMRQRFAERLMAHVRKVFPDECAKLGEPALRQRVEAGIARAEEHGFTAERDVVRFVDVRFLLGDEFEARSRTSWAAAILEDHRPHELPSTRMDRLWDETRRRQAEGLL